MAGEERVRGVIDLGNGFCNFRGSYKLRGIVELGTHTSLVRRGGGSHVFLDSYALPDATRRWVDERTDGGASVEAILNLHPFHTLHVRAVHESYPKAKLYGTARHVERFADLPWEELHTEDPALHELFADDFDFTVPRGVDFISSNENLHFSSVLAYHRASKSWHVDDTLMYVRMPKLLRLLEPDVTRFHPTLSKVLERRPGAARDFREWARELIERSRDAENLCAAHSGTLRGSDNAGAPIAERIEHARKSVESTLRAHEREHG